MTANPTKLNKRPAPLTEGPILSRLIRFVLPLMATNLLQTCYNAADMMIVSMSSEPNAVGAIGITGAYITLIVNLFMGFSVGSNVLVSRFLGAKDNETASRTVHTSLILSLLVGCMGMVIGLFISRPILALMGAQGNLLDLATTYTMIYFCGVPFLSLTNFTSAIFRAKGDTKTPLFVLSGAGLINVGLNVFFVLGLDMSVEGVAIATAISNLLSAIVLIWRLSKDSSPCRFSFSKCRINRRALVGIIREGLPAGIQSAVFSISNMLITSSIIQLNNAVVPPESNFDPVVSGNAAAANIGGFIYTAVNSVYQAAITFISQNVGAKKYNRLGKIMLVVILSGMAIGATGSIISIVFRDFLLGLYGVRDAAVGTLEHIAYETAVKRVFIVLSAYCIIAIQETGGGVVRGLGGATLSTITSLIGGCVFRVLWISFIFKAFPSLEVVYMSYPISWMLTGIAHILCSLVILKKLKKSEAKILT